jgi:hypothetical protein
MIITLNYHSSRGVASPNYLPTRIFNTLLSIKEKIIREIADYLATLGMDNYHPEYTFTVSFRGDKIVRVYSNKLPKGVITIILTDYEVDVLFNINDFTIREIKKPTILDKEITLNYLPEDNLSERPLFTQDMDLSISLFKSYGTCLYHKMFS